MKDKDKNLTGSEKVANKLNDFLVRNKPEEIVEGRDEQLEVAVRELLKQIDADPDRW